MRFILTATIEDVELGITYTQQRVESDVRYLTQAFEQVAQAAILDAEDPYITELAQTTVVAPGLPRPAMLEEEDDF